LSLRNGFIRPVENIGSLRFFSIAHERYLLALEKNSALLARGEIGIEDLNGEKIISFSRQNLSYTWGNRGAISRPIWIASCSQWHGRASRRSS
jgi:hypothetical protein